MASLNVAEFVDLRFGITNDSIFGEVLTPDKINQGIVEYKVECIIDTARYFRYLIKERTDPSPQSIAKGGISTELKKTKGRASHQIKNFYGCK